MNNYYATFGGVQDIVYNPFDATIYGYMSYRDGTQKLGGLIKLKQPDNGISVVQAITQTPNTSPGDEIAGLFINDQARMFGLFSNGNFARIDMQDGVYHNIGQSNVITDYTLNGGTAGNLRGDIGGMPNTTVLPINLAYFKGKIEQSNHVFYWQTYSEDNNREFILEASNDGRTWNEIATIPSLSKDGNSSEKLDYVYNSQQNNFRNYRCKQIDYDYKTEYSNIIQFNIESNKILSIRPNPAKEYISIHNIENINSVSILDVNGKTVLQSKDKRINVSELHAGNYLIIVEDQNGYIHKELLTKI